MEHVLGVDLPCLGIVKAALILYVFESMMMRCIVLIDQPDSTNRRASQSSSKGWLGRPPRAPKLSGVATSPLPKCQRQIRLTITRLVSGCAGSVSQRASSSRPLWAALNVRRSVAVRTIGTRRVTSSPSDRWLPRMWTLTSATGPSVTPIAEGMSGGLLQLAQVVAQLLELGLGLLGVEGEGLSARRIPCR